MGGTEMIYFNIINYLSCVKLDPAVLAALIFFAMVEATC